MKYITFLLVLCRCLLLKSQDLPDFDDIEFETVEDIEIAEIPNFIYISLSSNKDELTGKEITLTEDNSYIYKDSSFADGQYTIWLTKNEGDTDDPGIYGKLKGSVINGKKVGEWHKYLYAKDTIILVKTSNYSNGLLDGKYSVLDYNGDTLYYWTIIKGHPFMDGVKYGVFENGTGHYYDYYYDIGVLSVKGFMKNGKRHGYWYYYDRQGNKIREEHYNNGLLVDE